MYSPHKHSYLQSRTNNINPRIINRSVHRARTECLIDEFDLDPPFLRVTSQQPCIPLENVDVTRRPLAFGRWAMPKLRRELHDQDIRVVRAAINSIFDLVHDPERGYEAVQLRIPDRMADLLMSDDATIRERVCMALTVIAGLADGKDAIVKNQLLLTNVAMLVENKEAPVRIKAGALLEMVSRSWMASDELVDFGYINILLDIIGREDHDEIVIIHLTTLKALMYGEGRNIALDSGAFDSFVNLLDRDNPMILSMALECLSRIVSTQIGKEMAFCPDLLPTLYRLLQDPRPKIYAQAASAIMFCTIKSSAKIKSRELPGLPERLVDLVNDIHHPDAQIFSIKALTNICEHPATRKEMRENHMEQLNEIIVEHLPDLKAYKATLLSVVNWFPACDVA